MKNILSPLLLTLPLCLIACTGSSEDVRMTMCKELVSEFNESTVEITSENMVIQGYEDLEVRLQFKAGGSDGKAVCFYVYEAVDENAITLADPATAYSTYPSKVILNGEALESRLVAQKVNQVLLKQGKRAVDLGKQAVQSVNQ